MNKKIGIVEVARYAGVSPTTVSRVINKVSTVSLANRLKVEDAVKHLKFSPSPYAQALARGTKAEAIALVIPRYEGVFYSFYALELIRSIGTLSDSLRLDLLLHLSDGNSMFNTRLVAGIIFADIIHNRSQIEWAIREGIPTILINNLAVDLEVSCIAIDNTGGAREAVQYLIALGHKKIAHIAGDVISQAALQRLEGYRLALKESGINERSEYIVRTDYSRRKARIATEQLLALKDPPTAVFIASDAMALEAITVIMEKGLKVPDDISVVGFDDNPTALFGPVALTTVKQPLTKMGEEAVKELNDLINGKKELVKVSLPTQLIIRESCKAV